jgi:hypothetical protein
MPYSPPEITSPNVTSGGLYDLLKDVIVNSPFTILWLPARSEATKRSASAGRWSASSCRRPEKNFEYKM